MNNIIVDTSEFRAYFERLGQGSRGDFKKELEKFVEGLGYDFLRIVQDEIIRKRTVDTTLLLQSFEKAEEGNIWEIRDGGLTLEVGSNIEYAQFANDGHWTCKQGETKRFVPGVWNGNRFEYQRGSKTGMVLKQKWVEGSHFWESAIRIFEQTYPQQLKARLAEWIEAYFREFI